MKEDTQTGVLFWCLAAYLLRLTVVVTLVSSKDRCRPAAKGKSAKQKRTPDGVRFRCALMARRYMRKGRMNAKWKAENRKQ